MLRNLTLGRYLYFHKYLSRNFDANLNIYSQKTSLFWKRIQQTGLITAMMIQKNFKV